MYAVEVSDQIMIAHSFRGEVFGPAQKVHGATFVIRVAFLADKLDDHGIVVDIARAHEVLKELSFRSAITTSMICRSSRASTPRPSS